MMSSPTVGAHYCSMTVTMCLTNQQEQHSFSHRCNRCYFNRCSRSNRCISRKCKRNNSCISKQCYDMGVVVGGRGDPKLSRGSSKARLHLTTGL